ncbi:bleomycin resistance protein [Ancylobacter radicis]|uniref:Bleomycin resistance protein n=1 Tax=Ancylobacter radicis TaxID=2836179 RepID=A0ABS5R9D7_9HYPH|nr:VOC family protein [Ancylobacter radicis]MBS9478281.1 VOC family protein [Ancylobacter radicis]
MSDGTATPPLPQDFVWAALVPELLVTDIAASLGFWCGLCGFAIAYAREEDGFAYLQREGAQLMLEEIGEGRQWITGPLERPFGRGLNFQIAVSAVEPILAALKAADWPLHMAVEEKWYRASEQEVGVRQFLVQDPDGYLIRFSQSLGLRAAQAI